MADSRAFAAADATRVWLGLAGWLVLCLAAGAFGSLFQPGAWYAGLEKPPGTPPGWVFAPVWTTLYLLMAVAAWLVWKRDGFAGAGLPLTLFLAQLLFNAVWSWLYFGLQWPGLALVDLVLLWGVLLMTVIAFWRHRPLAAVLLLPYLAWVSYAGYLNAGIWWLNR